MHHHGMAEKTRAIARTDDLRHITEARRARSLNFARGAITQIAYGAHARARGNGAHRAQELRKRAITEDDLLESRQRVSCASAKTYIAKTTRGASTGILAFDAEIAMRSVAKSLCGSGF